VVPPGKRRRERPLCRALGLAKSISFRIAQKPLCHKRKTGFFLTFRRIPAKMPGRLPAIGILGREWGLSNIEHKIKRNFRRVFLVLPVLLCYNKWTPVA
jgi:hypothetical protein